jgi:hypothetical protein
VVRGREASVASKIATFCMLGLIAALLGTAANVRAQDKLDVDLEDPELSAIANTRWSMVLPERDYEGGCLVGFLAFKFMPNGYFIYNNRISGWWRYDANNNIIRLRTKDGVRFMLMVEADQLRVTANLPFVRRGNMFQKCPPAQ